MSLGRYGLKTVERVQTCRRFQGSTANYYVTRADVTHPIKGSDAGQLLPREHEHRHERVYATTQPRACNGYVLIVPAYLYILGLWLRLECSLDSLSIDSAHVIYVAEGHNVGAERQSSVMTLRKPIVTWII